jgi:Na(+)-translocating NADH:ubiquinone oxidoreductase C subunit
MLKKLSFIIVFLFPLIIYAQNMEKEIESVTNLEKMNCKNVQLQELLGATEEELLSKLEAYVLVNGTARKLKGDINLTQTKNTVRQDSPVVLPYWKVENTNQIILIMSGNGLWDRIGGYVLLDKNSKKIVNIVFTHKNETPGLGTEISKRSYEEKFIGLTLGKTHTFLEKRAKTELKNEDSYQIETLSGATVTCDGVQKMLNKAMKNYSVLLNKN